MTEPGKPLGPARAVQAREAGSRLFEAVDALAGHLSGHAHSCALMVRGDVADLLKRLAYLEELARQETEEEK